MFTNKTIIFVQLNKFMGNFIKWIGAGLGFTLGGPIGSILGFVVGSLLSGFSKEDIENAKQFSASSKNVQSGDFEISLLLLSALVIKADGKVDLADLPHVIAIIPKLGKFIEDFKAIGEAVEEGKDIDVAEIVALIQKIHSKLKEIEAA